MWEVLVIYILSNLHLPSPVHNDLRRALGSTLTAVCTRLVINVRNIVLHRDGSRLALSCAEPAADTTRIALLLDDLAALMAVAGNAIRRFVRNNLDQMLRACRYALAAGNAFCPVDDRNTVHYMDRIEIADCHTFAKAEAAGLAGLRSLARNRCRCGACLYTDINGFLFSFVAGAGTSDKCDIFLGSACLNAHDLRNLCGNGSAADRTFVYRCFALRDRGGKAVTTRISAGTAVIAGEASADFGFLGIDFDRELITCKYKHNADKKTNHRKQDDRNNQ